MESRDHPLRVTLVFASRGIGGAEQSMGRLMSAAHPGVLQCSLALASAGNARLEAMAGAAGVAWHRVGAVDSGRLAEVFRRHQTEVAYLFGQIRTVLWAWAARRAGVRLVVGAERGSGTRWINRLGRRCDRFVLDGYITNSGRAGRVLVERCGIAADRVFVVPNGIEVSRQSEPPEPPEIDCGSPSVVCVANIRPLKGHIVLLRAIRRLRTEFPGIKAVLVGRDLTDGAFFREVAAEGLTDTMVAAGYCPDVRGFLARADVFVLPSLYREGMPTSILEAMHAGLPVVGTRVGGVDELVEHEVTGHLLAPGDAEALAASLTVLLRSETLRRRLGDAGRARVASHFTLERMVGGHTEAFTALLARKNGRTGTSTHP